MEFLALLLIGRPLSEEGLIEYRNRFTTKYQPILIEAIN